MIYTFEQWLSLFLIEKLYKFACLYFRQYCFIFYISFANAVCRFDWCFEAKSDKVCLFGIFTVMKIINNEKRRKKNIQTENEKKSLIRSDTLIESRVVVKTINTFCAENMQQANDVKKMLVRTGKKSLCWFFLFSCCCC